MKIYKYNAVKVEGYIEDNSTLEELMKKLNERGMKGYKLHTVIPQGNDGSTKSTIMILEAEDTTDECAIG